MSMHLRIAAGVCALSTGLLVGGPAAAIAAADSGTNGATTQGDTAARPAGHPRGPISMFAASLRLAMQGMHPGLHGVTGPLSPGATPGQQQSNVEPPQMIVGGTPTVYGSTDAGGSTVDSAEEVAPTPLADDPAPPASEPYVAPPPAVEAASLPIPPSNPADSVPKPVPPATGVVGPVSNVIAAVTTYSVTSVPALVAALPFSATPISDVIASMQGLLTSVADAGAPLVSGQIDLFTLLGVGGTVPGAIGGEGIGSSIATGLPTPAALLGPAGLPAILPGFEVGPSPEVLAGPAMLLDVTTSGTSTGVASASTVLASTGDDSSVLSTVQQVIGAVVATVSLAALAAVALPGILGLLGSCAAGIRIGYRQAKAGSELPATAVARFVGSGPIGVVRSGSQISLRPRIVRSGSRPARPSRVERAATSSAVQLLDRAV